MSRAEVDSGYVPTGWPEWDAVACLLSGVPIWGPKLSRFMDTERLVIDWGGIEAVAHSHGEQLMVALARNLWDEGACPSMKDLVGTLDDNNFARAVQAMRICRNCQGSSGGAA